MPLYPKQSWADLAAGGTPINGVRLTVMENGIEAATGGGVSVASYGAKGDGTTNDTTAVQNAFNAVVDGGTVVFPAGGTYRISTVAIPNKSVSVIAEGATISTITAGVYAFTQANRKRVTWEGGKFTGSGSGFSLNLVASTDQSYDVAFSGVSFVLPAAQTAINLNGGREGTISECYFETCTGIRLYETVNTHITGCQFKNCTKGVFGDGSSGTAFNAGVMLNNCTMLGCGYGVHAIGHDWLTIVNSMIDYCDRPVVLVNQDTAAISDSYFSNREMGGGTTVVPTIQLITQAGVGGESTKHIQISNCSIICNVGSLPDQSIGVALTGGADWVNISNNTIHFWRKYGIQISGVNTYVKVLGNDVVSPAPSTGAAGLYGSAGNDSTWVVKNNFFSSPMANVLSPQVDGSSGGGGANSTLDQVRYVSKAGSDANDGLSWSTAKLTVAAGLAALSGNPGVVEIGAGTFTASSLTPWGQTLRGRDRAATSLVLNVNNGSLIDASNRFAVQISDMTLGFSSASITGTLALMNNAFAYTFERVTFQGTGSLGVGTAGQRGVLFDLNAGDSHFRSCTFTALAIGVETRTVTNFFDGCLFTGNRTAITGGSTTGVQGSGLVIRDCVFNEVGDYDINITGAGQTWIVDGCWFESATTAIQVGAGVYGPSVFSLTNCAGIAGTSKSLVINAAERVNIDNVLFINTGTNPTDLSFPTPVYAPSGSIGVVNSYQQTAETLRALCPATWVGARPATGSSDGSVLQVVKLTAAAYAALGTKVATTLYVIVG